MTSPHYRIGYQRAAIDEATDTISTLVKAIDGGSEWEMTRARDLAVLLLEHLKERS